MKKGDIVYVLRDWPERQVRATIVEVTTLPVLGGRRERAYRVEVQNETYHVHLRGYHYGQPRRLVYARPIKGVPIVETWWEN